MDEATGAGRAEEFLDDFEVPEGFTLEVYRFIDRKDARWHGARKPG
jgi:hypothetical protein